MYYGIIDLGSNTVRLMIFNIVSDEPLTSIYNKREVLGLAGYINPDGSLSREGLDLAILTVNRFKEISEKLKVDKLFVLATAAIRNATNSNYIVQELSQQTNLEINLLSGDEEALAGFRGIKYEFNPKKGLIVDIGGGSTEITVFNKDTIEQQASMPYGSLNTKMKFVNDILPTKEEQSKINQVIYETIISYGIKKVSVNTIYGVGGTLKAARKLTSKLIRKKPDYLTKKDISKLIEILDPENENTKITLTNYIPDRVHTILPGLVIIKTIFEYFDAKRLYIAKNGIREGFLLNQVNCIYR